MVHVSVGGYKRRDGSSPQIEYSIKSIERKKTSVQWPLGRKQFNVKIATEMELVYATTADGFHPVKI